MLVLATCSRDLVLWEQRVWKSRTTTRTRTTSSWARLVGSSMRRPGAVGPAADLTKDWSYSWRFVRSGAPPPAPQRTL